MPKLPDTNFPDFFANLNNLYDKVFSWNKSSVAPTNNLVPGEVWVDSGNQNRLKVRNDANSAWIDTQLRVDQAFWGLNPATAQFNASQLRGQAISTTAPTNGQSLVYNGTSYAPRQSGRVLQVVTSEANTPVASTSITFVSTGLSATITPLFATSKILIITFINGIYSSTAGTYAAIQIHKGGLNQVQLTGTAAFSNPIAQNAVSSSGSFYDSPATTSAVTYDVRFANAAGSGTILVQNGAAGAHTSSLILMEIAQ